MLVIKEKQLAVIAQNLQHKFAKNVRQFCRRNLPQCCLSLTDEALLTKIVGSIDEACKVGLCWQNNIATICILDIKFQTSVLSNSKVREHILSSKDPDIHFRHLFKVPASAIWDELSDGNIEHVYNA